MKKNSSSRTRSRPSGCLACLGVLALTMVTEPLRCQEPQAGRELFKAPNRGTFSIIRAPRLTYRLREARRFLAEGRHEAGIEALLEVMKAKASALIESPDYGFEGLRAAARKELGQLSKKAREAYERLVGSELRASLDAVAVRSDPKALSALALAFPHTKSGEEARIAAGDSFLERGMVLEALQEFALLDGSRHQSEVLARRLLCRRLLGLPLSRNMLTTASGPRLLDDRSATTLADWLDGFPEGLRYSYAPDFWPGLGGGLEGSRLAVDPVDPNSLRWQTSLENFDWVSLNLHVALDGQHVFANTGTYLYALDLLTGSKSWIFRAPVLDEDDAFGVMTESRDATNRHFSRSPALGRGIVVAALRVPVKGRPMRFRHIAIMAKLPARRLFAFEARSGRMLWNHWDMEGLVAHKMENAPLNVSGPPLIVGDRVYVATHKQMGGIAFYLSAFDLYSGAQVWKTLVLSSQIEVNMFGNSLWEFAASPLAWSDGVVYGSTNLGACFSIRADDGSIRWLRAYETIPMLPTRMRVQRRNYHWANNAPIVAEGICVLTPLDSHYALALAIDDGKILWRVRRYVTLDSYPKDNPMVRWLIGVKNGTVYFSGHGVATVPLEKSRHGQVLRPLSLIPPNKVGNEIMPLIQNMPRALLTKERIYFPYGSGGVAIFDHSGRIIATPRGNVGLRFRGNLSSSAGALISISSGNNDSLDGCIVYAYFDHAKLKEHARRAVSRKPGDPDARIALAELLVASNDPGIQDLSSARMHFAKSMDLLDLRNEGSQSKRGSRARKGLLKSLRLAARYQKILNPKRSRQRYTEAFQLGREIVLSGGKRSDLLALYVEAMNAFPEQMTFRSDILERLDSEHGKDSFYFKSYGMIQVGLYVLLERLGAKPLTSGGGVGNGNTEAILELYRKILVQHADQNFRDTNGRDFATQGIQGLILRHGRGIYARYEKEAEALLHSKEQSPAQMKLILDQYPLSLSATKALVRLARHAAERGDLGTALLSMSLAHSMLPKTPDGLLAAVAEAAGKGGNPVLQSYILARTSKTPPLERPYEKPLRSKERIDLLPRKRLPSLSGSPSGNSSRLFPVARMAGFENKALLPLLILLDGERVLAYAPSTKTARTATATRSYVMRTPLFEIPFRAVPDQLDSVIYGSILVLAEPTRIRGISMLNGKKLWEQSISGGLGTAKMQIRRSGPLASGLYCYLAGKQSRNDPLSGIEFSAIEPTTGKRVFKTHIKGPSDWANPMLRAGRVFRLAQRQNGRGYEFIGYDSLTGRPTRILELDGTHAPLLRSPNSSNYLLTDRELLFLAGSSRSQIGASTGLYSYALDGKKNWEFKSRRLWLIDSFIVNEKQILLTEGFQKDQVIGRLHFLDRVKGRKLRSSIKIGRAAFLWSGSEVEPLVHEAGPELFMGRTSLGGTQATLVDTREGGPSWAKDIIWDFENLRQTRLPGTPIFGKDYLILARKTAHFDNILDLMMLDLANGDMRSDLPFRSRRLEPDMDIAAWNGQLLVHLRDHRTWVFVDRMGK